MVSRKARAYRFEGRPDPGRDKELENACKVINRAYNKWCERQKLIRKKNCWVKEGI